MPYVTISTNKQFNAREQKALFGKIGETITLIPQKTAKQTMIRLDTASSMYKHGANGSVCMMEVLVFGPIPTPAKDQFVREMFAYYTQHLQYPEENIYIMVEGLPGWGYSGRYHTAADWFLTGACPAPPALVE